MGFDQKNEGPNEKEQKRKGLDARFSQFRIWLGWPRYNPFFDQPYFRKKEKDQHSRQFDRQTENEKDIKDIKEKNVNDVNRKLELSGEIDKEEINKDAINRCFNRPKELIEKKLKHDVKRFFSKLTPDQQQQFREIQYPMNMDLLCVEKWIRRIFSHEDHISRAELLHEIHEYLNQFIEKKRDLDREQTWMLQHPQKYDKAALEKKRKEISVLDKRQVLEGRYLSDAFNTIDLTTMSIGSAIKPLEKKIKEIEEKKRMILESPSEAKNWFEKVMKTLLQASIKIIAGIATAVSSILVALKNFDQQTLIELINKFEKMLKDEKIRETGIVFIGVVSTAVVFVATITYGVASLIDYIFQRRRERLKNEAIRKCDEEIDALEKKQQAIIEEQIEIAKLNVRRYFFEYQKQLLRSKLR
jgi:hypothetical protein